MKSSAAKPEPDFLSRRVARPVATAETDLMPLPAIIGALIFGLTGYFIGEAALASFAHPVHWLGAIVGAVPAYAAGLIWHRTRGFS